MKKEKLLSGKTKIVKIIGIGREMKAKLESGKTVALTPEIFEAERIKYLFPGMPQKNRGYKK